jgi:hypothetical protein
VIVNPNLADATDSLNVVICVDIMKKIMKILSSDTFEPELSLVLANSSSILTGEIEPTLWLGIELGCRDFFCFLTFSFFLYSCYGLIGIDMKVYIHHRVLWVEVLPLFQPAVYAQLLECDEKID